MGEAEGTNVASRRLSTYYSLMGKTITTTLLADEKREASGDRMARADYAPQISC